MAAQTNPAAVLLALLAANCSNTYKYVFGRDRKDTSKGKTKNMYIIRHEEIDDFPQAGVLANHAFHLVIRTIKSGLTAEGTSDAIENNELEFRIFRAWFRANRHSLLTDTTTSCSRINRKSIFGPQLSWVESEIQFNVTSLENE